MVDSILVVSGDKPARDLMNRALSQSGHRVDTCSTLEELNDRLKQGTLRIVVFDGSVDGKTGLKYFEELSRPGRRVPAFLLLMDEIDDVVIEKVALLGTADVSQKPIKSPELIASVKRLISRSEDKILDLMETIRAISGITLDADKRPLVETRLLRRLRQLNFSSVDQYYQYFLDNRGAEVPELVSLVTTHTTHFFREVGHFEYLTDTLFPKLIAQNKRDICIWSAAASSGEEAYSLAICYLEFLRKRHLSPDTSPKLKIIGSDIDLNVIQQAKNGVYLKQSVERLDPELVKRYFDQGNGQLARFIRVKNLVHQMCEFRQVNLIGKALPAEKFEAIFLRNVLIYFKPNLIKEIVLSLRTRLQPHGVLILGHSESLSSAEVPFEAVGNSIYRVKGQVDDSRHSTNGVPPLAPSPVTAKSNVGPVARRLRVFIIDDSATIRRVLRTVFTSDSDFEVVGEAEHPKAIGQALSPADVDVVTLDIHMPVQDGISYLREIQGKPHPPVVMVSSVNYDDAVGYMNCLELGAVDYIEKPSGQSLATEAEKIRHVVKAAAAKKSSRGFGVSSGKNVRSATAVYLPESADKDLVLIGASTGGVEALKVVLESFPNICPPIVIVQHIPPMFSKTFADRLNQICPVGVSEAVHGEVLKPNHAYIAPGGKQLALLETTSGVKLAVSDDPPVNRHKPSVDFLFQSAVPLATNYRMSAAILTGMGGDGAEGLLSLRQAGVHTIAQDEESCVVFGMPKVAIEKGGALEVVPLRSIAYHLLKSFAPRNVRAS